MPVANRHISGRAKPVILIMTSFANDANHAQRNGCTDALPHLTYRDMFTFVWLTADCKEWAFQNKS